MVQKIIGKNSGWETDLKNKFHEIIEEIKIIFSKESYRFIDTSVPLFAYVILSIFTEKYTAFYCIVGLSLIILIVRLIGKQKITFILSGFGIVALFFFVDLLNQDNRAVLLPSIISGSIILISCLGSVLIGKPLAAYSSAITRRWPLDWYWHPNIKPAYRDVTLLWFFAFGGRSVFEIVAYNSAIIQYEWLKLIFGWPYTIIILVISYLVGSWRLQNLKGPSVEEFKQKKPSPWKGQQEGF